MQLQMVQLADDIGPDVEDLLDLDPESPPVAVIERRTPAEELAWWREPKRQALLLCYVEARIDRVGLRTLRILRDELRAGDDLAVLERRPDMAPVIVAVRDGLLEPVHGPEWRPVVVDHGFARDEARRRYERALRSLRRRPATEPRVVDMPVSVPAEVPVAETCAEPEKTVAGSQETGIVVPMSTPLKQPRQMILPVLLVADVMSRPVRVPVGESQARYRDITGMMFEHLVAIEFKTRRYNDTLWTCICLCGELVDVPMGHLVGRQAKRCRKCNSVAASCRARERMARAPPADTG